MNKWNAPKLHMGIGCIISDNADLSLVADVLCHFQENEKYYNVFTMPTAKYRKSEIYDKASDDYFCNVVCKRSARLILNSLSAIKARNVILIGLDDLQLTYLDIEKYYNVNFIEVANSDDIINCLILSDYMPIAMFDAKLVI